VEGEQVAQGSGAAVVARGVDEVRNLGHGDYCLAPMRDLDLKVLRWMRTHGHSRGVEDAAVALGKAGNNALVWFLLGAALAVIDNDRWESWLICALLGPFAIGLNYAIKLAVKRPRPVLEGLPPLGGAPSSLSFPSAHATSSFAVATAMVRVDPAMAATFVVAFALALGRPYLGMHYPSDVLAGAFLGVVLGLIVPLSI
jgi:membrane-associated phospholipid phosphatase